MYEITLDIEQLPEGPYLATSPDLPGLIVQTDGVQEILRLAPDVAHDLMVFAPWARVRRESARNRGVPREPAEVRRGLAELRRDPRRSGAGSRRALRLRGELLPSRRGWTPIRGESPRLRRDRRGLVESPFGFAEGPPGSATVRAGPPKVPSSSRPYGAASRERARRRGSPARSRDDAARDAPDPRAGAGCRRVPAWVFLQQTPARWAGRDRPPP